MIKLRQTVSLKQQLKLSQILSPKMIQMLKTFSFSYSEVLDRVARDVEDNVVLEVIRYDHLAEYAANRRTTSSLDFMGRDISEFAKARSDTDQLHTFLFSQLDLETLSDTDDAIARFLISHMDDRGYIEDYVDIRALAKTQFGIDDRKVLSILRGVQKLEPDGVGARSLKECLLLQIESHHFDDDRLSEAFKTVVTHHLDALGAGQFEDIATAMGIASDGVAAIAEFIRANLNPFPGLAYATPTMSQTIIPSFEVVLDGDQIELTHLEQTMGIQIGVSDRYIKMLADPGIDEDTRTYVEDRVRKANELIDTIQSRQRLMADLVRRVVQRQTEFLKHGLLYLVPLLQKELAEQLGMSPSTISRIVSSKYILTPQGIFTLKQLCPRDHFGLTAKRLEQLIMAVFQEYPGHSDLKIATLLADRGMPIARRTVTKYRLLAGVTSSFDRLKG